MSRHLRAHDKMIKWKARGLLIARGVSGSTKALVTTNVLTWWNQHSGQGRMRAPLALPPCSAGSLSLAKFLYLVLRWPQLAAHWVSRSLVGLAFWVSCFALSVLLSTGSFLGLHMPWEEGYQAEKFSVLSVRLLITFLPSRCQPGFTGARCTENVPMKVQTQESMFE